MKKPTIKRRKSKIGRVGVVEDFLPSPDTLVLRDDSSDYRLTDEQAAEVRRRLADPNRRLVSHAKARKRIARLGS